MLKPGYSEPAIGWNSEDNKSGVIKYGVANYEPRKRAQEHCKDHGAGTPGAPRAAGLLQEDSDDSMLLLM